VELSVDNGVIGYSGESDQRNWSGGDHCSAVKSTGFPIHVSVGDRFREALGKFQPNPCQDFSYGHNRPFQPILYFM